ncbi:sulfite exporter TauE/SafE family protein [Escherichia coli]
MISLSPPTICNSAFNSLFMVSPLLLGVLFFVAMLAGFIDSIAGGGGLLTIPALMAAGMSPANALATNKLQACGGSISATIYFIRRKVVSLSDQKLNIAMTFVGSMSGALLVQYVQADVLRQILPILVICIGLYFLLMPKLGEEDRQRRMYGLPFALIAGGCVGFYDGFFGPAAGSFYALAFVTLCGFNLAKATAHAKLLNATSNIGGLLLFILGGKVIWATGFVMLVGQFLGARMGSRLVLSKGQKLIRPMIVIVSAVMSAKLLYDSHGQEILHWLGMN